LVSFVKADPIGLPDFATNAAWSATLPTARIPGQRFQSESGLHQHPMRDPDPTLRHFGRVVSHFRPPDGRMSDGLAHWNAS
jgi:hypothetical protein